MTRLYQATTHYFCAGLVERDGVVIDAAPILAWAIGKSLEHVRAFVKRKRGTIEHLSTEIHAPDSR